jgi:hypothetical protein
MTLHATAGAPRVRVGALIILIAAVLGLTLVPTADAAPKQTLRHQLQTLKKKNRQLRHSLAAACGDLAQARHDLGGRPSRKSIDEQIQGLRGYLGGRGSIMNRALVLAENHRRLKVRYAARMAESAQAAAVIGGSGAVSVRARQALSRVPGVSAPTVIALIDKLRSNQRDNQVTSAWLLEALGGTGSLTDRVAALKTALGGSGSIVDRAKALADDRADARAELAQAEDQITIAEAIVGGPGPSLVSKLQAAANALGASHATITAQIASAQAFVGGAGPSLMSNLQAVGATLGAPGSAITEQIGTPFDDMSGDSLFQRLHLMSYYLNGDDDSLWSPTTPTVDAALDTLFSQIGH